jgi:hypothetical protein
MILSGVHSAGVISTGVISTIVISTGVNFVAVEAPSAGMALSREAFEFFDAALGIVSADDGLQVVANELIQAFAESLGFLAGSGDELLVDGESDVHAHMISGHVLCVNPGIPPPPRSFKMLELAGICRQIQHGKEVMYQNL